MSTAAMPTPATTPAGPLATPAPPGPSTGTAAGPAFAPPTGAPTAAAGASPGLLTADLPGRLTRLRLLVIALCVLFGSIGAAQLAMAWDANRSAAADTQQLIRVQGISANLLHADALATNAFLIGGLEPAQQRAAYDGAIEAVSRAIADAAQAQPADRAALGQLNDDVVRYAGAMEQARANNRQGFPVGASYLRQASADLRSEAIPVLDALVTANGDRAQSSMGGQHPWLVALPGLVVLAALFLANRWIAARFKRRINVGVATAAVVVLVLGIAGVALSARSAAHNADLAAGSYRVVVDGSKARTFGNDAKANESLRLIARGSGQAFEKSWATDAAAVTALTDRAGMDGIHDAWADYEAAHKALVALDDKGQWDQAVSRATEVGPGGSTGAFTTFDERARSVVDAAAAETTASLGSGNLWFLLLAGLTLLGGLAAAGFAAGGVDARRKEYA